MREGGEIYIAGLKLLMQSCAEKETESAAAAYVILNPRKKKSHAKNLKKT
jgi:hypothetical protein